MPERLIKQMKKLDGFNASQDWQNRTRSFLVNKVNEDTLACKTPWTYNVKVFLMNWQDKLTPAPAKVVSFLLLVSLISGTGIAARASYRPNTMLYSVWEMVERAELVLATTPTSQTKVYLKHVEKSVNDAKKLANSENLANEEKSKYINTVVTKIKKDLNSASASLDIAEQTKGANAGITGLAKKVTENTKNTVEVLNQVLEDSGIEGVDKVAVDKAIATTEVVEGEAIKLLLSEQDLEELSDEEVKALVVDKIVRATEKIVVILEYINESAVVLESEVEPPTKLEAEPAVSQEEVVLADMVVQTAETEAETVTPLGIEQINDINQIITESQEYLDMANASLEESNLDEALKNVEESNKIINQINEILGEVFSDDFIEVIETGTDDDLQVEGAIEILNDVLELDSPTTTETTVDIFEENQENVENLNDPEALPAGRQEPGTVDNSPENQEN